MNVFRAAKCMKLILDVSRCKSCEYCINFCPKGVYSLSDKYNMEGYRYIVADESKCTYCGICYTMCPDNVIQILEDKEVLE